MAQENQIGIDDLIEAIEQHRIKFFLESQSGELELQVAIQKGENDDSKVFILGTFSGVGLDGLRALKVKIPNDPGDPQGGSKLEEKLPRKQNDGDPEGG